MSDAALRVPDPAAHARATSPRTRRSCRRRAGRSRTCTSSSADWSAAAPTTCRPIRTARSGRASCSRSARCRPAARRPRSSTRCRTRSATCSPRDDFLELRRDVAGVRALLHAGDHRDAEAVAREPLQPVQPARGRAADAHAHAGRARAQRAGRLRRDGDAARGARRRWPTPRCARSSSSTTRGAPVGMFTLVDLLRRVVLPDRSLDSAARRGDDVADRHAARRPPPRTRRCT